MAYDKVVDSAVLDAGLKQIADAIREKGETTNLLEFPTAMAEAITAIEASGKIFGTSKYEVGSVIAAGLPSISIPKPDWVSDINNVNIIVFTVSTYAWDAGYWTVMIKIIRDAVTVGGFFINDASSFSTGVPKVDVDDTTLLFQPATAGYYTVYGSEYFYIIWESE